MGRPSAHLPPSSPPARLPALQSTLQTLLSPIAPATPHPPPLPLATLLAGLFQLGQTLRKQTTTLGLALGKKPVTVPAGLAVLGEGEAGLGEAWKRVLWLVRQVDDATDDAPQQQQQQPPFPSSSSAAAGKGGGRPRTALGREWAWWAESVHEALVSLLRIFLADAELALGGGSSSDARRLPPATTTTAAGAGAGAYLGPISLLYKLVDALPCPTPSPSSTTSDAPPPPRPQPTTGKLSQTADEACLKRWKADGEGLLDGEREAKELVAEAEAGAAATSSDAADEDEGAAGSTSSDDADANDDDDDDDDWARLLGASSAGQKPTGPERELIRAVRPAPSLPPSFPPGSPPLPPLGPEPALGTVGQPCLAAWPCPALRSTGERRLTPVSAVSLRGLLALSDAPVTPPDGLAPHADPQGPPRRRPAPTSSSSRSSLIITPTLAVRQRPQPRRLRFRCRRPPPLRQRPRRFPPALGRPARAVGRADRQPLRPADRAG